MVRVVLAVEARQVKMRAAVGRCLENVGIELLKSFSSGDLLDQIDNASAQLAILYAHKRLGERKTVGCREEVGDVGRRWRLAHTAGMARRMGSALGKK